MLRRVALFILPLAAGCAEILDLDDYNDMTTSSSPVASSSATGGGDVGGTGGAPDDGIVWAKSWGGPEQQRLSDFSVDNDDRIVLAGNHDGAFSFGAYMLSHAGASDFFVTKVDASASLRGSRSKKAPTGKVRSTRWCRQHGS